MTFDVKSYDIRHYNVMLVSDILESIKKVKGKKPND